MRIVQRWPQDAVPKCEVILGRALYVKKSSYFDEKRLRGFLLGWKHQISHTVFSKGFIQSVRQEIKLFSYRLRCFSPINLWKIKKLRNIHSLKLNIGAGKHRVSGWVNVDLAVGKDGIRWDLRWPLPIKDKSVTRIHCEHFLEHLEYPGESEKFVKQCFRILKSSGDIRIIVPDAEKYIHAYTHKDKYFWDGLRDLGGANPPLETEIEIINQAFRMGGDHRYAYDRFTLTKILNKAGFQISSNSYAPQEYIDQGDDWRQRESLYLVATKHRESL